MHAINIKVSTYVHISSIVWSGVMLFVGFLASFSIGKKESLFSLLGFFLIFILPVVSSIVARWRPFLSGIVLLASILFFLGEIYSSGSILDVFRVMESAYPWFHFTFGTMFIWIAKQKKKHLFV